MNTCNHSEEIIDVHEGSVVCVGCGLVKENYYYQEHIPQNPEKQNNFLVVDNFLDKFNFTEYFADNINKKLAKSSNKNIKKIASEIYKTANENNSCLPLKSIMNVSGLKTNQIMSNDIHIFNVEEILEKYTKILNLDFKTYTVIKEKIMSSKDNGFQPLSIIGGFIYLHCQEANKKISMKKIASTLGISPISIQRFVKHAFSSRS